MRRADGMRVAGVILAGGLSTRMGRDKALVPWQGRALVEHVALRLRPQVDVLALSANGDAARFRVLGPAVSALPVLADEGPSRGPLSGIAAALRFAVAERAQAALIVPCDAPQLPADLACRLAAALTPGVVVAAAISARGTEPLFSLWHAGALPALDAALAGGGGSVMRLMESLAHRFVPFADREGAFCNMNRPDDLRNDDAAPAAPGR